MVGEKLLSETACRGAKPTEKVYYLNDGGGLRLRCRPDGSRAWIYRYRLNGKERAVGLALTTKFTSELQEQRLVTLGSSLAKV